MLLTLKPPLHNDIKTPRDYSHHTASAFQSPRMIPSGLPPPGSESSDRRMSNPHRGLPPPSAMSLPPPERPPADRGLPAIAPLGNLPAPPQQWQGADESMRNWLAAKAEEDRRRQEEERTRQEGFRLDQRKIEQTMLRESLAGGIPPVMVPLIFAGMGGGSLPNTALEWAQHYLSQMSLQAQQQGPAPQSLQPQAQQQAQAAPPPHHLSSEARRGDRMIPPNPYGSQQPLQPAPHPQGGAVAGQAPGPAYGRQGPTSDPQQQPSSLPPLKTGEIHLQGSGGSTQPMHAIQHGQAPQQDSQQASSPSIYFHHWVPPSQQSSNNPPATPSSKSQHGSPFSQSQQSHLRSEHQNSPKKRKATGSHQPPPPPTSQPADRSPPYSQGSSAGTDERREGRHSRQHSATSSTRGYDVVPRPSSRQQRQEAISGVQTGHPSKPQTPTMSSSEHSMRASSQAESRQYDQSRYAHASEMRQFGPPTTSMAKREE